MKECGDISLAAPDVRRRIVATIAAAHRDSHRFARAKDIFDFFLGLAQTEDKAALVNDVLTQALMSNHSDTITFVVESELCEPFNFSAHVWLAAFLGKHLCMRAFLQRRIDPHRFSQPLSDAMLRWVRSR